MIGRHAGDLSGRELLSDGDGAQLTGGLRRIERYWTEQIRFIY
jgi:hypothetical protein